MQQKPMQVEPEQEASRPDGKSSDIVFQGAQDSKSLQTMPKGVLVFPFVVAAGLTFLVLVGLGQPVTGVWILLPIIIGLVAAFSSLGWSLIHRPPATMKAPASKAGMGEEEGTDPLANIHIVESQARRYQRPCPNCGTQVKTDREHCPNCEHVLLVQCKSCRTKVRLDWGACPECGRDLP
jgi:predicted RNA-binding Zn-ribbon protein involved in translation (DUF1610 family)